MEGTPPLARASDLRAALLAGLHAAGPPDSPARHAFIAELAFRLARLGPFLTLDVRIEDTEAATEGALSVLAQMAVEGQNAQEAPGDAISLSDVTRAVSRPANALVSVQEACGKRSRACLACGAGFEVNFRHAKAHRFCSAACRSRYHRLLARRESLPKGTEQELALLVSP